MAENNKYLADQDFLAEIVANQHEAAIALKTTADALTAKSSLELHKNSGGAAFTIFPANLVLLEQNGAGLAQVTGIAGGTILCSETYVQVKALLAA